MNQYAGCTLASRSSDSTLNPIKVAITGACASGKSSVAIELRKRGIDAFAVGQEHSIVPNLWNHKNPDFLIFLDISLDTIRQRRSNPHWPSWIYDIQQERLKEARTNASIIIDTVDLSLEEVVECSYAQLRNMRKQNAC